MHTQSDINLPCSNTWYFLLSLRDFFNPLYILTIVNGSNQGGQGKEEEENKICIFAKNNLLWHFKISAFCGFIFKAKC